MWEHRSRWPLLLWLCGNWICTSPLDSPAIMNAYEVIHLIICVHLFISKLQNGSPDKKTQAGESKDLHHLLIVLHLLPHYQYKSFT